MDSFWGWFGFMCPMLIVASFSFLMGRFFSWTEKISIAWDRDRLAAELKWYEELRKKGRPVRD